MIETDNANCLFPLTEAYEYGVEATRHIIKDIPHGRCILNPHDGGLIAQAISDAKHADHVEIGTFYGGSAILAAMVKNHFSLHGTIYAVDPLDRRSDLLPDLGVGGTTSARKVMSNAEYFNVEGRISLITQYSRPWPLVGRTFATGYIDGDHWHGLPLSDARALMECVGLYILFDDYMHLKPEVIEAAHFVNQHPDWRFVHISGLTAVLRKRE